MADEEKDKAGTGEDTGGKKKKMIIFGAIGLVVLLAIGAAVFFFMGSKKPVEVAAAPQETMTEQQATEPVPPPAVSGMIKSSGGGPSDQIGPMVEINGVLVNLLDLESTRYLKASLTMELSSEEAAVEVEARMTQIRDAVLLLCGNKTFAELRDLQGKMQLRAELIGHINTFLRKGQVKKIYFTEFVIQ